MTSSSHEPSPPPDLGQGSAASRAGRAATEPQGVPPAGEAQILRTYLGAIYRRRWTALGVFAVVFSAAVLRTFSATPIYEATAQILIDADSPNVVSFEEVQPVNRRALDYFQTQYRLLTGRALAKRALELSNLMTDPAFIGPAATGDVSPTAADPLSALRDESDPASPDAPASLAESVAVARFLGSLRVTPIRNSRLVDVTFASPSPAIAQRGANAIVEAYISQAAELKSNATKEAVLFLSQMVAEQRKAVEQSELALQKYREDGASVSLEDRQNIIVERLAGLNQAATKAKTERIQAETLHNQLRAAGTDDVALASLPTVLQNPTVQRLNVEIADLAQRKSELGQRLGENHPDMVRVTAALTAAEQRLRLETTKIAQAVRSEYTTAVDLERVMTDALDRQKAEALDLNRRGINYGVLQRDAAMNRQLYEALLQRTKQTGIAEQLRTSTVRIVDTAELPRKPARPNRPRDAALGFVAATVLALGLVLSLEAFDTRIKSPDDITQRLGLASLGMVPECARSEFGGGELLINATTAPPGFVEAFRSLRTSMLFASAETGCRLVLVSSNMPGEGKTLVSSNLAVALAMSKQRVLLVDADMRRPKAHDQFGRELVPGLSNVLVGDATVDAAIQATGSENLQVLSAGTLPPNPPELLGSPQFGELMTLMAGRFDWIVIDSPPVRAVSDALLIAHLATAVVFVIGAEMTDVTSAKAALVRFKAANAKMAGAVLNKVQLRRHSYYYAQHYGRSDERYYVRPAGRA